jgi:hypothetical protein
MNLCFPTDQYLFGLSILARSHLQKKLQVPMRQIQRHDRDLDTIQAIAVEGLSSMLVSRKPCCNSEGCHYPYPIHELIFSYFFPP